MRWAYIKGGKVVLGAVRDVDESILNLGIDESEKMGKERPAAFTDFRKLLEDKSIDAVSIATPNHQHTWMTIAAVQAGKDVYCEKPCAHNMFETKQIVAATRKYDRLVQHGVNMRSVAEVREAIEGRRNV